MRTLTVYTDGSGTKSDQHAGIGVVVMEGDAVLEEHSAPIGLGSNVMAEVRAIRRGIELARRIDPDARIVVYSDSRFAIDATAPGCDWNIRDPELERFAVATRRQRSSWWITVLHVKGHRPLKKAKDEDDARHIRGNRRADELAGKARKEGIARDDQRQISQADVQAAPEVRQPAPGDAPRAPEGAGGVPRQDLRAGRVRPAA